MIDFQYCQCPRPVYCEHGKYLYCRLCWLQEPPRPPAPSMPPLRQVAAVRQWIEHSNDLGMSAESISRDLDIPLSFVRYVIAGATEPAYEPPRHKRYGEIDELMHPSGRRGRKEK